MAINQYKIDVLLNCIKSNTYVCDVCGKVIMPDVHLEFDDTIRVVTESADIRGAYNKRLKKACKDCIKAMSLPSNSEMSDYKDMKNTDKYTIALGTSNGDDNSALNVVWDNNGLYTPECVGTPIIDEQNRVVIGMITQCDDKYVRGVIWAKKSVEHFFDGKMASISFEIGKVK